MARKRKPGLLENTADPCQRVVERLEEDIVFGRLHPRERLIEEDLAGRFDVKRHVVRQALGELEHIGIVVRRRGRGAVVRDFQAAEVANLYMMREMLESKAAEIIPLPADEKVIENLLALHVAHSAAVKSQDLSSVYRLNVKFHQVLFSACGNPFLMESIDYFALKVNAIRFYSSTDPDLLERAREEHGRIVDALREGDRQELIRLCLIHLQPARQAYEDANLRMFPDAVR